LLDPGSLLPPGALRTVAEFLTGHCIEDQGWRIAAAFFTFGASEITCNLTSLADSLSDAVRDSFPWKGYVDSSLIIGLAIPFENRVGDGRLPGHINATGLSMLGEGFVGEMMRRGMLLDLQHGSEKTKNRIVAITGNYPLMASHGGVQLDPTGTRG